MDTATVYTYNRGNGGELRDLFGKRPGFLTKDYFQYSGFNGKWMFWDEDAQKYHHVRDGDQFVLTDEGPRLVRG